MEHVTLRDTEIPVLGFGTARFDSHEPCRRAVESALEIGYRHIDTAQKYDTERAVGDAIAAAPVDRDEVFVTTKLGSGNRRYERVFESTRRSLEKLQTDYVDLLLVHAPDENVPTEETVRAMNELQAEGAVRHIGVSNFSVEQLREAMDCSETPILTNQVEYNAYMARTELLSVCQAEDVMLTAYSPLSVGCVADDAVLKEIGDRHGKTAAQVAIRWLIQQENVAAIPKAADHAHQAENFDVFDFELTDEEMQAIFDVATSLRARATRSIDRLLAALD